MAMTNQHTSSHEPIVLMIDDDPKYCNQIKTWFELKNSELSVEYVTDPGQAIGTIQRLQPGVVLLDYDMGTIDGLNVLENIRETFPEPGRPLVIFVTNFPDKKLEALENGAFAFFNKRAVNTLEEIHTVVRNAYRIHLLRNWNENLPLPEHFLDPLLMSGLREVGLDLYANDDSATWSDNISCITVAVRSEQRVDRLSLCTKLESRSFLIPGISDILKRELSTKLEIRFTPKWIDAVENLDSLRILFDPSEQARLRTILAWPLETFGRDQIAGLWVLYGLNQEVASARRKNIQMFFGRWSETLSQVVGELYLTQLERQVAASTLRRCAADMGMVAFGLATSTDNPPEVQWARETLIRHVDDMEATADAVLRNGRLVGAESDTTTKTSLHQLVAGTLRDMRPWAESHHITIEDLVWNESSPPVRVRPEAWRFVCRALLGNGVEAFLYGDPDLLQDRPRRIQVRGYPDKGGIVLEVVDTGLGLADENRCRVFTEEFSTKGQHRGSSLMLAREIVKEQGGTIVLGDSPPSGFTTVFRITLLNQDS